MSGPAPAARMNHTATLLGNDRIFIFGGFNRADRVMNDAHTLDLSADGSTGKWGDVALTSPVPEATGSFKGPKGGEGKLGIPARSQHSAAATRGFVYLYGGYDGAKPLSDLWLLDTSSMSARQLGVLAPAPEARSRHCAHVVGNLLHIFGGYDNSKNCAADVFTLDCEDPASAGSASAKKEDDAPKEEAAAAEEED